MLDYYYLVGTPCQHIFHKECLRRHVQHDRRCPIDGLELSREWLSVVLGESSINLAVEIIMEMGNIEGGEQQMAPGVEAVAI